MGCSDSYCFICGLEMNRGYGYYQNNGDDKVKFLSSIETDWIAKITVLVINKEPQHNFYESACNFDFTNGVVEYTLSYVDEERYDKGFALHTDCWKYVKKTFNIELNYDYLKNIYHKIFVFPFIDYTPVNKYWRQEFNYEELEKNKKHWYILHSPLSSTKESLLNSERIKKNIKNIIKNVKIIREKEKNKENISKPPPSESPDKVGTKKKGNDGNMWIVIKTKNNKNKWSKINDNKGEKTSKNNSKDTRPSPSESATLYKVGTKKKGNDGNMWIIKESSNGIKRWSKYKILNGGGIQYLLFDKPLLEKKIKYHNVIYYQDTNKLNVYYKK
jgi:hypothetical protein